MLHMTSGKTLPKNNSNSQVPTEENHRIHVLHVDDDDLFLKVSKQILESDGNLQVDIALTVDDAVDKLAKKHYDAIISDYEMPQKNGLEFLKRIRETDKLIPFVLFTGKGQEDVAIQALNMGASRYISKHGSPETVYDELSYAVKQAYVNAKAQSSAKKLRKQKEFNDRIINSLEGALLVIDPRSYKIIDANKAAQKHAQLPKKKLIGKTCYEVTHQKTEPCKAPEHECPIRELVKTGKPVTAEHTHIDQKNNEHYVEVSAYPMIDPDGLPVIVHVEKDITERKRLEHALLMSEKNFRSVSISLKEALILIDSDGNIEFWNPAAEKMFGYTSTEVMGKSFHSLIAPVQSRAHIKMGMKNFQATGQGALIGKTIEITALRKDGKEIPIELSISSFQIENDQKAVGVARDISERKILEEKLLSEATIWKRTFDSISDYLFVFDKDLRIEKVNKAVLDAMKKNPEDLIGKKCYQALHNKDSTLPGCPCGEVLTAKKTVSAELSDSKSGKYSLATASPILNDDGELIGVVHIHKDISELKKQEIQLRASQQKFAALFSSNPEAIVFVDVDLHVIDINSSFSSLFGYTFDEGKGKEIGDLIVPGHLKDEYLKLREKIKHTQVNGVSIREKKDGSLVKVAFSGAPVIVDGKAIGFVMAYKDISEISQVQEELAKALAQTKMLNEKLNTVGTFTRHDLKNKLSVLNARLYILKKSFCNDEKVLNQLNELASASKQMQQIMEFETAYVQIGMEKLQQVDVETFLKEAASLHSELKGIELINECHGLKVEADSLLRQIFFNLIDDSLKYGKKVTRIRVLCENNADGAVNLIYEDNGEGISENIKKQLFHKGAGIGTGLGLYLIKRICDYYGWSVQETGSPGVGVRFEFKIPANASAQYPHANNSVSNTFSTFSVPNLNHF